MLDVAFEAQLLVFEAAKPYEPRDNAKSKQLRAASRLGEHGLENPFSRVERAWRGRAGARVFLAIKTAFERWQESNAAADTARDAEIEARFASLMEAMNASDADFYRPAIEAMRATIRNPRRVVRENGGQD